MTHIVQVIQFGSASTGGYTATVLDNEGTIWTGREVPTGSARVPHEFRWTRVDFPRLGQERSRE